LSQAATSFAAGAETYKRFSDSAKRSVLGPSKGADSGDTAQRVWPRMGRAKITQAHQLVLRRRLQIRVGGLAQPELSASLGFRVNLGAEEERESADPEPGQHDDHRGE
jgi:hypothetical protein